ncbi:probable L-gulonolactone oxidase 6 [Fagus crenata]
MYQQVFQSTCLFLLIFVVCCSPPEDPIKCSSKNTNCTITNSYGVFPDRSICQAAEVVYPSNEEELISIVAEATRNKRKMKVSTRFSHSIPKLVCPDGQDGLLISTNYLNHTLKIDVEAMTMTVESGVTLRQLINEAAKAGLALPYTPYWWGLTIGGLLSTGAHGSTLWSNGSAVHDYLLELRIVRRLKDGDKDFNAAKVSLGVLGVISQVTLKLQPLFKRSITYLTKNDSDLGDIVASFGNQHEFADITWYPSQRKAIYRIDDRVSSNTPGNGLYDFTPFRPTASLELGLIRTLEEGQESLSDVGGKCINADIVILTLTTTAYGLTNNGIAFTGYPVIGYHNHLQASGTCLDSLDNALITACAWDPRAKGEFFHQTTFSVSLSMAKNFIQDVQKLIEFEPKAMCGVELYNGILMRYVKASSAYLGKQEDAVDFDITYYRSKDPMTPRLYEDILEEVEQLALYKYGALPHWGKNRNVAFDGVIKKYKNGREFLKVKELYDPFGLFSSEWTDQVLGLKNSVSMDKEVYDPLALFSSEWTGQVLGLKNSVSVDKEGCALEGLCICSQDFHCAPTKGYYCRPGKVYKDARVCTHVTSKKKHR